MTVQSKHDNVHLFMNMRLEIYAADARFRTIVDSNITIYDLRKHIEQQYAKLSPFSPPLASHALSDAHDYMLPDTLILHQVLQDGDRVYVVCESQLRAPSDANLELVLPRWRTFQEYTFATIKEAISTQDIPRETTRQILLILFDFLGSTNRKFVSKTVPLLYSLLCPPTGNAGLLLSDDFDETRTSVSILLQQANKTHEPTVSQQLGAILFSLLENASTRAPVVQGGVKRSLIFMTKSDDKETRQWAHDCLAMLPANAHIAPNDGSEYTHEISAEESKLSNTMNVEESIDALETSEVPQVHVIALETLMNDLATTEDYSQGRRIIKALTRICSIFNKTVYSKYIATILVDAMSYVEGSRMVREYGGFQLLVELAEDFLFDASDKPSSRGGETKESLVDALRVVSTNKKYPIPLDLLVNCTIKCSNRGVREILAETLIAVAKADDTNYMHEYIPQILSIIANASQGSQEEVLLSQVIGILSVKEENKGRLIKYGAPKMFAHALTHVSVQQQRVSAKILANLASCANTKNRQTALSVIQRSLPDTSAIEDSIVAMYLEMIFT